jgi:hypothetical protein
VNEEDFEQFMIRIMQQAEALFADNYWLMMATGWLVGRSKCIGSYLHQIVRCVQVNFALSRIALSPSVFHGPITSPELAPNAAVASNIITAMNTQTLI